MVGFTKPLSKKFRPTILLIIAHYQFGLQSAITLEERRVLVKLTLCSCTADRDRLLGSLLSEANISKNVVYFRTGMNAFVDFINASRQLMDEDEEHRVRYNLYSFIWDRAFSLDSTFDLGRDERCCAVVRNLKEYNDVAQHQVDFMPKSNHDGARYQRG